MLTHVVLFRFDSPDASKEASERLRAMAGKIPSLKSIEAGVNVIAGDAAYDVALVTRFDDQTGLDAYRTHPVHLEVVGFIREHATARATVDYLSTDASASGP